MPTKYVPLYMIALALGVAALWWFVFPDGPDEAVKDGVLAGVVATVLTGMLFGRV
jgi:hypothetical protein